MAGGPATPSAQAGVLAALQPGELLLRGFRVALDTHGKTPERVGVTGVEQWGPVPGGLPLVPLLFREARSAAGDIYFSLFHM